ncbi:MAG: hypothetical protein ACFBSE_23910 [Prochloraceae cyanobacterium]
MTEKKTQLPPEISQLGLSLGTIPLLLVTIATENGMQSLIELGQAAEEVFRGDLLPILHLQAESTEQETEPNK